MTDLEYFRERLNELIFDSKENVLSLSKQLNVGKSTLYHYLKGETYPNLAIAVKLADFFSCPLDYFFGLCHDFAPKKRKQTAIVKERVKLAIDESGKSRYTLSKCLNIPQPKLSLWYHGKTEPNTEHLILLTKTLGVSLDFLAGREE